MLEQYNFLHFVDFVTLSFWDVKRLSNNLSFKTRYPLAKLEKILIPRKEKIKKQEYKKDIRVVAKITFNDGKIYLRDENKTGMDLYKLYKDDLLISNINFHQGATSINDIENELVCSTHYQPYIVDYSLIDKDYLIKILRNNTFLEHVIKSKSNGIKTESKYSFIKEVGIPLPKLETQKSIVKQSKDKIKKAERLENKANELEKSIDDYLIKELGITYSSKEKTQSEALLNFVHFKDILNWDIWNRQANFNSKSNIFELNNLNSKQYKVWRGKSPKYNNKSNCIILNQKCNRWNYLDLTHAKNVDKDWFDKIDKNLLTKAGDILINSTGEGTIGRATNITSKHKGLLYDSHILLLRLNNSLFSPLYYTEFFNSRIGQEQVESIKSAKSTKQTELGTENLKKIKIPIPPLKIQNKIAKHIKNTKNKVKNLRKEAERLRTVAIDEFNKEVF